MLEQKSAVRDEMTLDEAVRISQRIEGRLDGATILVFASATLN